MREEKPSLKSNLEPNSLDDFVSLVEMSKREFEVQHRNDYFGVSDFVDKNTIVRGNEADRLKAFAKTQQEGSKYRSLKVPRRPEWTREMSAEELQAKEVQSFIEWRRDIAQ